MSLLVTISKAVVKIGGSPQGDLIKRSHKRQTGSQVTGLHVPVREYVKICNSSLPAFTNSSETNMKKNTFFERLYLISGLVNFRP